MTSRREFLTQTAAGLLAASIVPVAEAVENDVADAASRNLRVTSRQMIEFQAR